MPTLLYCPSCNNPISPGTKFCASCGHQLEQPGDTDQDPLVGQVIGGRFRVEAKLGEGGMGAVYQAEQVAMKRKVALKVLHRHLAQDEDLIERFHREAGAAARLNHPNTIIVHDFGQTDEGTLYIAMEFVDGGSLSDEIDAIGAFPWNRAVHIASQIAESLADAHSEGIVHRDLKPDNVMLITRAGQSDVVKLLDFGIAKVAEASEEDGDKRKNLTKTGMIFGTPQYMSPEQIRGSGVDHRTDIYALGVIIYQLLTGQLPFLADNPMGLLTKHLMEPPRPISQAFPGLSFPPQLEALVMRCLEKDADRRYQSMTEIAGELSALAGDTRPGFALPALAAGPAAPTSLTTDPAAAAGVAGPQQAGTLAPANTRGGFTQQPTPGGYTQQPAPGGTATPGSGGFAQQPSSGGFGTPTSGGYGTPTPGGFAQQPSGGFADQPSSGGFTTPASGGFAQQPSSGGFAQQPSGGFAAGTSSGFGATPAPAAAKKGGAGRAIAVVAILILVLAGLGVGGAFAWKALNSDEVDDTEVADNTPPVETPPVETPPVETPPVETPPVETPPVETPPVETPPVVEDPIKGARCVIEAGVQGRSKNAKATGDSEALAKALKAREDQFTLCLRPLLSQGFEGNVKIEYRWGRGKGPNHIKVAKNTFENKALEVCLETVIKMVDHPESKSRSRAEFELTASGGDSKIKACTISALVPVRSRGKGPKPPDWVPGQPTYNFPGYGGY